jgi:hypothetical protein
MLLAMCFDASMLISLMFFFILVSLVFAGLVAVVVMGVVNLADARRKRPATPSLSGASER